MVKFGGSKYKRRKSVLRFEGSMEESLVNLLLKNTESDGVCWLGGCNKHSQQGGGGSRGR